MKTSNVTDKKAAYKCNQCDFKAGLKFVMQKHIQLCSDGLENKKQIVREYACNECEWKFSKISNLNRHIESQHRGTLFPCEQCDKQFKSKDGLQNHHQSIHEKIEIVCPQCDYVTGNRATLRGHMISKHNIKHQPSSLAAPSDFSKSYNLY